MSQPEEVLLKNPVSGRDHVAGPETAPVTLLEYGDFECPHCGQAYPVIKEIQNLLNIDLRFAFRNFPTTKTNPHAIRAAEAAEAAAAQGKFWQMHDELFTHQHALEDHDLLRYAKRIGLDIVRFEREMSANAFLKQIEADYQLALFDEHITGTPTFYLNGLRYTGATDIDGLLAAIKEADTTGRIHGPQRAKGLFKFFNRNQDANR